MLTEEKIKKNAQKFNDTGVKYGVVNDELMGLLGTDFITAPCTTTTNLYGAYDGGLIQHILNVTKYAIEINGMLPSEKQVRKDLIIRVCLIHQIGKANMYSEQTSQWHKDNRGEMYVFNDESLSMSTAERSVFYALKSGIELTEDEVFAIYNYNSDFAHWGMKKEGEKLASLLKTANMIAIMEEK
jgi:23S rRNA maturation-related 3'-5' exoribonuclease YhaM